MLPWRMGSRQLLCARAVPAREPPAPRGEAGISGAGSVGQHRYAGLVGGGGGVVWCWILLSLLFDFRVVISA